MDVTIICGNLLTVIIRITNLRSIDLLKIIQDQTALPMVQIIRQNVMMLQSQVVITQMEETLMRDRQLLLQETVMFQDLHHHLVVTVMFQDLHHHHQEVLAALVQAVRRQEAHLV